MESLRPLSQIAVVAAFLGCALSGCGSAQRGSIGSEQTFREVDAPGPSVPTYTTEDETSDAVLGSASHRELVSAAMTRAAEARTQSMGGDARLGQLAEWIGERLGPDGEVPPNEVIEFFARTLGLVEPSAARDDLGPARGHPRGGTDELDPAVHGPPDLQPLGRGGSRARRASPSRSW